jgi:hypothetical protein
MKSSAEICCYTILQSQLLVTILGGQRMLEGPLVLFDRSVCNVVICLRILGNTFNRSSSLSSFRGTPSTRAIYIKNEPFSLYALSTSSIRISVFSLIYFKQATSFSSLSLLRNRTITSPDCANLYSEGARLLFR